MSSRSSESCIVAIDTNGEEHFVSYGYDYGGGYYRSVTALGDQIYEVECSAYDECADIKGQELPRLSYADIASYFTEGPSEAMRLAIQLANLPPYAITNFVCVTVCYASWWFADIGCTTISAAGKTAKQFMLNGVANEIFGNSVFDVAKDILEKGVDGYATYLDSVRKNSQEKA